MKRPITNLLLGCLAIFALQLSAQTTTFTISPTTVTAAAGSTFTVNVTVNDFDEIVSFQYSNNWDPAILDFVEVTNISSEVSGFSSANFGTTGTGDGELSLSWFDNTLVGVTLDPNTVLYSLTFQAISATGTDIIISGSPTPIEIINTAEQGVTMNSVDSAVNGGGSGNPPPPPPTGDLTIIGSDETAQASSSVCVAVTASDFTDIVSMQYSMHWDENILSFTGVQSFNTSLTGLGVANFGTTATANGDLTVSWFDNTTQGVSVSGGATLYEVCFDVTGSSGQSSTFTFDGTPTTIEVIDVNSAQITPTFDAGSVTVSGGTPPPPPTGDLTITGSDETAQASSSVCVAVTANNFTDIVSMQYSMHWDENILSFTGVQSFNSTLTGLGGANFGTTATANGDLTVSWFDNTTQGVSVSDGATLYEVCFDVTGSSGQSSTFTFDGTPTTIEVIDVNSAQITPTFDAGSVTVSGGTPPPPPTGDLTITGSDETAQASTSVCLAVTANDFTDIVSMQYSMHWDENILSFTGVQAFGLPDLSAASFGTTATANGDLSVSWFDNTTQGITLTNGTTLYEVCFNVIGSNGQSSTFTFDGTPTVLEVVKADNSTLTPTFDAGSVTVSGGTPPPPPPIDGFAIIASDETVQNGDAFCVSISVNDFTDIVSMQYAMEWDEALFQYTGVQGFGNLPDLSAASFGTTMTANGVLSMSWFDNTTEGITLTDGTVIYEVCFNAIGANDCNSSSDFTFSAGASSIEIVNAQSQEVTFQGVPGELTICDGVVVSPMSFNVGNVSTGENAICVPVTVENPACFVSSQFSMNFNTSVLSYTGVQGFGLPEMAASNFNSANAGSGVLTFSWFDQTTNGVTPAAGATIFEVCFNVIGNVGDVGVISIVNAPTIIEVVGCNSQNLDPDFNNGAVTVIEGEEPCPGGVGITSEIVNDVNCFGSSTGSIDLSVGGGNNSYAFVWENSSNQQISSSEDIFGQTAGEYCVTVTSCNGMTSTNACYTIGQPASGMTVTGSVTNPSCFGDATGAIDLTVSGGSTSGAGCTGYTFFWSNDMTTEDLSGLAAGVYAVTVTDCNGCQMNESFSVVGAPSALTANATAESVTCFDDCDGTITAFANGGVGPYEYRLTCSGTQSPWQTGNIFTGQCAGNCFVSIRDEFGCIETAAVTVPTPAEYMTSAVVGQATNGCNGSIDLTVTGGTAPLGYSWTGPDNYTSSNQDIFNLCPGDYCVTITDVNGCTRFGCETVIAPLTASADPTTIEPACFGVCDGEITLNFEGGSAPFTYSWSGGLTGGPTVTDVCPGSYTVTITANDGQSITIAATVAEASAAINVTELNIDNVSSPTANDGSVSINATGGFGGFTYVWSPGIGMAGPTINNLGINDYSVVVTDIEGCTGAGGPYIVSYDPTILNVNITSQAVCGGSPTGVLNISVTGGLSPYNFSFDGPTPIDDITDADGMLMVNNLLPGTYTVTVTDAAGGVFQQTDMETEVIPEVELVMVDTVIFPVTNGVNGKIEIDIEGGNIPYNYQWSNGFLGQNPSNLEPGCYDLTVTDQNGCADVFEVCVAEFTAASNQAQPDCPDESGSITVVPGGSPNMPFTYVWTNANGQTVGDGTATLANVPVGTYTVVITDGVGRFISQIFELNSVSNLSAALQTTSDFNGFAIRCHGSASGEATVTATDGMAPYTYQWSNGSTNATATGLPAGPVSVTVMDGAGCNFNLNTTLTQPNDLTLSTDSSRDECAENSGVSTANPVGGVSPFDYSWDDELAQTSRTAVLLKGGIYNVVVTDDNGCTVSAVADVPLYVPLIVQPVSEPDEGGPDGKAIANVTSGTWPYEYVWSGFTDTDSILTELLPKTYNVIVTDAAGCEELVSIRVEDATICLEAMPLITPEGDGLNEEFEIGCLSRYSDNTLQIFNRWGQLVYEAKNYSDANLWRGTTQRGNEVPDGVYYFVFDYLDPVSNSRETQKGSVTVLRK